MVVEDLLGSGRQNRFRIRFKIVHSVRPAFAESFETGYRFQKRHFLLKKIIKNGAFTFFGNMVIQAADGDGAEDAVYF